MQKSTQILRIYVSPNSRLKGRPNIEAPAQSSVLQTLLYYSTLSILMS